MADQMMPPDDGFITDPGMIQALEAAWEGRKRYLGNPSGAENSANTRVGQDAYGNPTSATPESAKAALLAGQDPRGQYTGANPPGSPMDVLKGGLSAGGMALQVGSALAHPAARIPQIARGLGTLAGTGRMGAMVAQGAPGAVEAGMAATGATLAGGSPTDVAFAAGMPLGVRVIYNNFLRTSAKAAVGALTPDQTKVAMLKDLENKYGPISITKGGTADNYWKTEIRPHNDVQIPSPNISAALGNFPFPTGITGPEQIIESRLRQVLDKYKPTAQPRNTYTSHQGVGAPPSQASIGTVNRLGTMYDDSRILNEIADFAHEHKMDFLANKIAGPKGSGSLKEQILKDMIDYFPNLSKAREASYKEGSVKRLWEVASKSEPSVEWFKVKNTPIFTNAFTAAEREEIHNAMDVMSSVGGGAQWLGRILGHAAIGGILGTVIGGVGGGGSNAAIGGGLGVITPYVMGEMLASKGGRFLMVQLMKRDPVGATPAAINAIAQYWIAHRAKPSSGVDVGKELK